MSYTNSSNMGCYNRNYNNTPANETLKKQNIEYLKLMLPRSEHHNIDLYIDPGGNISRDCCGNIKQDINKIIDKINK